MDNSLISFSPLVIPLYDLSFLSLLVEAIFVSRRKF